MNTGDKNIYVCPDCKEKMDIQVIEQNGNEIKSGVFVSPKEHHYTISEGLPDFTFPAVLEQSDAEILHWYEANADVYDEFLPLTFHTFNEDEVSVRKNMIDKLALKPDFKVLEVGAGTGRDSVLIAEQLSSAGELHMQDLCRPILEKSIPKMQKFDVPVKFHIGNACNLPFPDNYFDASFHFGGLNTFSDIKGFLAEMNRVTRVGGKAVIGDESMPEWLRNTEFGKILMNSNPHYKYELPFKYLPVSCRNVKMEWIIGGVFYVIDYVVSEGEPYADFDFEIPGARGGTHRTRYQGHLEGVTQEAIDLARRARDATGKSMHRWLDDAIKAVAQRDIEQGTMSTN